MWHSVKTLTVTYLNLSSKWARFYEHPGENDLKVGKVCKPLWTQISQITINRYSITNRMGRTSKRQFRQRRGRSSSAIGSCHSRVQKGS